jgi:hypothetical protein
VGNSDHPDGLRLDGREGAVVSWFQVDDQTKEYGGASQPNNPEDETRESQVFSTFPGPRISEVLTRCDSEEDGKE